MNMHYAGTPHRSVLVLATLGILAAASNLLAGPLTPPPGPVAATQKTLAEVEPRIAINATNTPGDANNIFKITQPGSYYLTGNITGVAGKNGIGIAVHGVTIDLNGFAVIGVAGSAAGIQGMLEGITDTTVMNGSIRNWGTHGLYLGAGTYGSSVNFRLEKLLVSGCTYDGITAGFTGVGGSIADCSAYDNGANGIGAAGGVVITSCSAYNNGSHGIVSGFGSTVSDCSASTNGSVGIYGGSAAVIDGCSAQSNVGDGIIVGLGSRISNCTTASNDGIGINAVSTIITDCTVRANALDGIRVTSHSIVRGNQCIYNGSGSTVGAGIHVSSSNNRIEGNNCTNNDTGIDVDSAGNIIIRNSCANNAANWAIAANNIYGPILDRTAPASPAVSTDSATGTMGSTDSNANFTY